MYRIHFRSYGTQMTLDFKTIPEAVKYWNETPPRGFKLPENADVKKIQRRLSKYDYAVLYKSKGLVFNETFGFPSHWGGQSVIIYKV